MYSLDTTEVTRFNKRKWFPIKKLKKSKGRQYPAETMTNVDQVNDLALLLHLFKPDDFCLL